MMCLYMIAGESRFEFRGNTRQKFCQSNFFLFFKIACQVTASKYVNDLARSLTSADDGTNGGAGSFVLRES